MKRYAVIRNNLIESVILWDGVSAYTPDSGTTLMLEADAIAAGIQLYVAPDLTVKAKAAVVVNQGNITQDQSIATQADTLAGGTGTLTTAQLTTAVRQLAQAVAILARNDIQSNRQRTALIQLVMAAFDDTNV